MHNGQVAVYAQARDKVDAAVIAGVVDGPGNLAGGISEYPMELVKVIVDEAREAKYPGDVGQDQVEEEDGAPVPALDSRHQDPHHREVERQPNQKDEEEGDGEDDPLDGAQEGARILTKINLDPLQ